jgi:hypothetical protein
MLTTILAHVIAAVGLATILASGWSFVMLAFKTSGIALSGITQSQLQC